MPLTHRKTTRGLLSALCAFSALLLAQGAAAVPVMTANASVTLDGGTPMTDDQTSSSQVLAVVEESGSDPEYEARGAADVAGRLAVSSQFFGASGTQAVISSGATWTEQFDFAGGSATFDFYIAEGIIAFEANNVGGLSGTFKIDISLNGVSIFSTGAQVDTISNSPQAPGDLQLTNLGTTTLNSTFETGLAPGFGLGGAGYRFDAYSDSLDLTPLLGNNTLVYSMMSGVSGLIGETSAIASIGDPLNLGLQPPGATLTVDDGGPAPASEPASIVLLALGLGLVATRGRRRQPR